MTEILLHGFWRSSAAYRVRIALALKGLAYRQQPHDLIAGEQHSDAYAAIAPHHLVPALEYDGQVLIESPAILEWIDAKWPEPQLLPANIDEAAIVRGMAALIACDIHPLNNLRVLNAIRGDFDASNPQVKMWIARWITQGFNALEILVARHGGGVQGDLEHLSGEDGRSHDQAQGDDGLHDGEGPSAAHLAPRAHPHPPTESEA